MQSDAQKRTEQGVLTGTPSFSRHLSAAMESRWREERGREEQSEGRKQRNGAPSGVNQVQLYFAIAFLKAIAVKISQK